MSHMINVSKPYLPPLDEYQKFLEGIWQRHWLTNHGPLVKELEMKLRGFLNVKNIQFLGNGTIPLQMAIKVFGLQGEIITTPFSYVATTGAILWENCQPVFSDIESSTFCIDADKIEEKITKNTKAILATHVFGFPCDVVKIKKIADKHKLKVIYDGAHAFGVNIFGKSIFEFGDITTCSFHATKLFHTIEGGAIFCNDDEINQRLFLLKSFGHLGEDYFTMGINAKNSEFHAAMGLCNLPHIPEFIQKRKKIAEIYRVEMAKLPLTFPLIPENLEYNYSYFPVIFESEHSLLKVKASLEKESINTRRYFYPSLNKLPYLKGMSTCSVSEKIAEQVLCLPMYEQLTQGEIEHVCKSIKKAFEK